MWPNLYVIYRQTYFKMPVICSKTMLCLCCYACSSMIHGSDSSESRCGFCFRYFSGVVSVQLFNQRTQRHWLLWLCPKLVSFKIAWNSAGHKFLFYEGPSWPSLCGHVMYYTGTKLLLQRNERRQVNASI